MGAFLKTKNINAKRIHAAIPLVYHTKQSLSHLPRNEETLANDSQRETEAELTN